MENIVTQIRKNPRSTPVKVYLRLEKPIEFPRCFLFEGSKGCYIVMGEWSDIAQVLRDHGRLILECRIECDRRQSAVPLLDILDIPARIEPGAILRQQVSIGKNAVILMGAIVNIGAAIGEGTMVDMGAVIGSGVRIGKNCHIGAGAVLAGVVEPASDKPVSVGDGVMIGANAVVLEGVSVGNGAVIAAGAVVTENVAPHTVVAGCPARFVKYKDGKTAGKTALTDGLR